LPTAGQGAPQGASSLTDAGPSAALIRGRCCACRRSSFPTGRAKLAATVGSGRPRPRPARPCNIALLHQSWAWTARLAARDGWEYVPATPHTAGQHGIQVHVVADCGHRLMPSEAFARQRPSGVHGRKGAPLRHERVAGRSNPAGDLLPAKPQFNALADELWSLGCSCMQKDPTKRPTADDLVTLCAKAVLLGRAATDRHDRKLEI